MAATSEETLLSYLKSYRAYEPSVIPGQQSITFLTNKTGLPQVWKWDGQTSEVQQFIELPDRALTVNHSPSGTKMIIGSDTNGDEKQQFYLISEQGASVEELVVSKEHFHHFGGWSPDETKITFSSNRRHPGYFDVYILDIATKKEEVVYPYDGNCNPVCWTKDGKGLILSIAETNIDNSLYIIDIETKEMTKIGKKDINARYHSIQLTKDGERGYLVTDEGRDTLAIHSFTFDNPSELEQLAQFEKWDIEEIKLSPDEKLLAYTINEGGISRLQIYHLKDKAIFEVTGLPSGVYSSLSWMDDVELVIEIKSAILPGDLWSADLKEKNTKRLTYVGENKDINHLWVEPELCHYSSFDGLEVPYFLYGKKEHAQPVMIYVHGGPESQIRNEYNPVIQFLAAQGYAVVAPNVRGSMGYGRKYVQLDDVRKRMDAVADLKWLVEDLTREHGADPEKIAIMGRSYGGFMVLAAITQYPELWAAAVDIVGISHFKTFLENTGPWRRRLREKEYGSLKEDVDFFEEIAPLNHTDKITTPLLIFHGRNDTRVPVSEAEQLTRDLEKQGKEVELIVFEDEGHQTENIKNQIEMNTKIVAFMKKHLQ
ncbi:S9 family peptidase [Oceanobacillus polygoni]|uniref:Dipeptidyl aminopeptidase/acylaminoacyl peptidase n=1 Tax=Oceanobacillus polygoni TaxID=1235259 RepID=A0A9X0YW45_9BACI|nr:S9 family peptidase [Oceanobacillus polygoni]MBP2079950.1 dipeptidyl aminopeptidase/acylaminoacyl peptidase [Oceanobacillus polygoni]